MSISPRDITALFYERALRDDLCPIVAGRRLIPRSYLPQVLAAMRAPGSLSRGGGVMIAQDRTKLTPPELAAQWGIDVHKVLVLDSCRGTPRY